MIDIYKHYDMKYYYKENEFLKKKKVIPIDL